MNFHMENHNNQYIIQLFCKLHLNVDSYKFTTNLSLHAFSSLLQEKEM